MTTQLITDKQQTRMVAHRGLSGVEKENTHAAFIAAGNRSYYGVETDVHVTADGQYVCFHDDTTGRVAGASVDLVVEETDFDILRGIPLLDMEGKSGRVDLRIPTLEEYVRICRTYGKVCVLELKNYIAPEHVRQIVEIIRGEGYLEKTIFISFDFENMRTLRGLLPKQPCQFLTDKWDDGLIDKLREYALDLDILYRELTQERIARLHMAGLRVNCWICDDAQAARQLIDWGVDFITSDILE